MKNLEEYLRRNLIHAKSVGAVAGVEKSLIRICGWEKPPKWLVKMLKGALDRARVCSDELAAHRNECR